MESTCLNENSNYLDLFDGRIILPTQHVIDIHDFTYKLSQIILQIYHRHTVQNESS